MSWLEDGFGAAQQWLFEAVVQPVMFVLGMGHLLEDGYAATGWLLVGLVQILLMLLVIGPLQRWRPVEPVTDRAAVRTDVLYTLVHRLGLFRVGLFFTLQPVFDEVFGRLRVAGFAGVHIDNLWPGVSDLPLVSFAIYLIAFDFADYWIHRGQHTWRWWWSLHALHHSQRQMTMWSDNRNHLLDDVIRDVLLVLLAQLIGVAPGQFVAIVAVTQLSESLQHANLRLSFGRWGERLWISPRFHRLHHSIGIGHEGRGRGSLGGHNFGVLLPWWDMLFGTANFEHRFDPTGIRDQVEKGRDYGRGFWSQQWLGLKRLVRRA
ncbi:MAG TPA: sterol desaturase family protein [Ramlibacter sp.]|jgi:sterol desaturase/sphingolipid hydroxylase (fatty acid hydroxylase superfamily)|uniref:sterol desaturase family protein n=1 Tax=Ramlibacter sp. TaxID=1917967 RepID=UPI002D534184|nr:sterol desaturase family protein [Ramlibacter sp.]HZY20531.1 sterol desaturase family protein [Ramlibacter sp.]